MIWISLRKWISYVAASEQYQIITHGTVSVQYVMPSIAALTICIRPAVRLCILYVKLHVIKVTIQINQQVWYKMKDAPFTITRESKSPTGNTTTIPRSTTASNSTASDRRLALQAMLSEIDCTVRHLFNVIHMAKNEHKLYFICHTELKHDALSRLTK